MRWNKSFEGTFHIEDADLQKMAKMLGDVNIKECPYFDISDKYGNSARYYRENQWIPVSERLPSDHERYLLTEEVHYTTGRIIKRVLMAFYDDENDEWYEEQGEDVEVVSYPLAWMQLPEPYKGGQ